MQITEENRAMCAKCKKTKAMCYMNQLWICGECIHEFTQEQIKLNQKTFLEG